MTEFSSSELRVNKILDHNSYYGVVFGQGRLAKKTFQECFEYFVLSNQADIFKTVKEKTTPMEVRVISSVAHIYYEHLIEQHAKFSCAQKSHVEY